MEDSAPPPPQDWQPLLSGPPSHSGQWPLALLLAAPLQGMRLESWETGPGVGVPALQGSALASGCDEAWSGRSSRTRGLGTTYQGARRGSKGAWGRRFARKACWAPLGLVGGGNKAGIKASAKISRFPARERACLPAAQIAAASAGHLSPRFAQSPRIPQLQPPPGARRTLL